MCVVCTGEELGYVGGERVSRNVQRWDGSDGSVWSGCGGWWWELNFDFGGRCVRINTLDKCVGLRSTKYEVRWDINLMSGMERHDWGRIDHWDNAGKAHQWGQCPMDQGIKGSRDGD